MFEPVYHWERTVPDPNADLRQLLVRERRFTFRQVAGEVIGNRKWSETHVTSSGGGGFVGAYGGVITAPSIQSRTVTRSEIWIRDEAGQERPLQLAGLDIPVREGHRIAVVWAVPDGKDSGEIVLICNQTSGQSIANHKAMVGMSTRAGCLGQAIGLVAILSLVFTLMAANPIAAAICIASGYYVSTIWKKHKADMDLIRAHIDRLKETLQAPKPAEA